MRAAIVKQEMSWDDVKWAEDDSMRVNIFWDQQDMKDVDEKCVKFNMNEGDYLIRNNWKYLFWVK
jgi:hypothetical protein